jgi:hypothetical protein
MSLLQYSVVHHGMNAIQKTRGYFLEMMMTDWHTFVGTGR